jgi:hypothetical protein
MVPDRQAGAVKGARRETTLALGVFLGLAFALYGSTLRRYWLIDDLSLVHLGRTFLTRDPLFLLHHDIGIYWRPVVKVWFALDALVWGYRPLGYRLTSVLLHAVASWLVFRLAGRLLARRAAAWTAGLLFALHPIHFAAVGWISARYDLACTVFTLAALLSLLSYLDQRRARSAIGFLGFQFLALFSKELAFTLPILATVVALTYGDGDRRTRLRRAAPVLALSFALLGAVLLLRVAVMGGIGGPKDAGGASSLLARDPLASVVNLALSFFVALFYPMAGGVEAGSTFAGVFVLGAFAAAWAFAVFWWRSEKRGRALVPFVLMLVAGLPFAPFLAMDRDLGIAYMFYLPSAFFAVGAGGLLFGPRRKETGRPVARAAVAALVALLYVPMLASNTARYSAAADFAEKIRDGVVGVLGRLDHGARVYLRGFPTEKNGALLYLDPNLIFLDAYDTARVRFIRLDGDSPPPAAGEGVRFLQWNAADETVLDRTAEIGAR